MQNISQIIDSMPWSVVTVLCLTLGLAPFRPPHILEKLSMLVHGTLQGPLDIFDFFLHGLPWLLLLTKLVLLSWRTK